MSASSAAVPLDEDRFNALVAHLPEGGAKTRIKGALNNSTITNDAELRAAVGPRNIDQATALLSRILGIPELDASILAGLLVPNQGKLNFIHSCSLIITFYDVSVYTFGRRPWV